MEITRLKLNIERTIAHQKANTMKLFSAVLVLFTMVMFLGCSDNETDPEPYVDPSIVKGSLIVRFAPSFSIPKTIRIPLNSFDASYPSLYSKLVYIGTKEVNNLLPHRFTDSLTVPIPTDTFDLESFYVISFDTNKNVVLAYESLKSDPIIRSVDYNYYVYIDDLVQNPKAKNPTSDRKKVSLMQGSVIFKKVK